VGLTIGLALIRQFISQRDNMRLTRHLQLELAERQAAENTIRLLNTELEARVQDRTTALTREIADRKQAQSDRERLITELKAKNTELERFTHTVSHDLKAPLITIRGFLSLLEKDALSRDLERMRHDIERINEASEKMGHLLTELLELSRIGRMMNPSAAVPFEEIVTESIEMVRGRINVRDIRVELTPGLPVVFGDRLRLIQVMQNLLDNAAKFMGRQPAPCITIGQQGEEDEKPVLYVKDNGIGISLTDQDKIFNLFTKLDPSSEGTGIGLSLVKRIIEVHGGRIWAASEGTGQGTTFYFTLPRGDTEKKRDGEI
jgi:two-component system, LuxR family, sensor kinase FixL